MLEPLRAVAAEAAAVASEAIAVVAPVALVASAAVDAAALALPAAAPTPPEAPLPPPRRDPLVSVKKLPPPPFSVSPRAWAKQTRKSPVWRGFSGVSPHFWYWAELILGGEGGIRTHGTGIPYA